MDVPIKDGTGHYCCIQCVKKFASIPAFKKHLEVQMKSLGLVCSFVGLYKCKICGLYYKTEAGVRNHCQNLVRCGDCGIEFHTQDSLLEHWQV